jgi:hypothetical protein
LVRFIFRRGRVKIGPKKSGRGQCKKGGTFASTKKMNPSVNYGAVVDALADAVKEINCAADPTLGATLGATFGATLGQAASSAAERGASAQKSEASGAKSQTVVIDFGRYSTKTFVAYSDQRGTRALMADNDDKNTSQEIAELIGAAEADSSLWVNDVSLTNHVVASVQDARENFGNCSVVLLTRALAYDESTRTSMRELIAVLADRGCTGVAIAHPALLVPPVDEESKSCLVVDIGEQSTCMTAVHEGRVVASHTTGPKCGGATVTDALRAHMQRPCEYEDARKIKEAVGYVADCADPTRLNDRRTVDYTLKKRERVTVPGTVRTRCFESILVKQSNQTGKVNGGILPAIERAATELDKGIRDAVCSTVYVVGGTSRAPGLTLRIWNELLHRNLGVRPVVRAVEEERFLPASFADIAETESDFQLSSWGPEASK